MSTYNKTVWQDGDIITADKMNNIENGIYSYNEDLTNITEEVGSGKNQLDPTLLYTGTLAGVIITREDDEFIYNGTASGSTSGASQNLNLTPGETYTFKIYTASTKKINTYVRFFDSNNATISTIIWNQAGDLNSPKTFAVPANTAITSLNIGPVQQVAYANDSYRFSIQRGTTNETYDKYGKILTAIDLVARENSGTSSYNALTNKPSVNNVTLEGELSLSDIGAVSESDFSDITESYGDSPNLLDSSLLWTGTTRSVVISRVDDKFVFDGTASGTDSNANHDIPFFETGKTYTAIIFSESTSEINVTIRFYNSTSTSSANMISMVSMRDGNNRHSLNTGYTFTVPEGTVKVRMNLGVMSSAVYDAAEYYFEIVEGSVTPEEYKKYGAAGEISAIDRIARVMIEDVGKPCYVSPTGNDGNAGTENSPFATFQHAVDSGYKTIIAEAGEYKNQQLQIVGKNGIRISCNSNSTGATLFDSHVRRSRAKIDNSIDITDLVSNSSVYRTALSVDSDSSFYKVFVSKELDPVYSGPEYYGRITTYNAILWELTDDIRTCTRLVPRLTLAECQSAQGSFFFDGSYLYINPTGGSITGKTYKRLNLDTTQIGVYISNCTDMVFEGIDVAFFPYNDMYFSHCSDLVVKDCCCTFTAYRQTFQFAGADAIAFSCLAGQAGADGYGISTYGNVSFYDCSAIRCYDDGISHHDASTGVIDGGEWAYCLKGGVTPSYGSKVDMKNVYCHDNLYGIYYPQSNDRHTDAIPVISGCLSKDNTNKDIYISGYNVVSHGCVYQTKQVDSGSSFEEYGNTILTA